MPISTSPSLLERLRVGEADADWETFVDLYAPLLFNWANRICISPHDAADLVQDIFATLVEKLPQFRYDPAKSFRGWLKTVMENRWRSWLRQAGKLRCVGGDGFLGELPADSNPPDLDEAEYRRHLVQRALTVLRADFEPVTLAAFWEFVVLERPASEVAAELGITSNTVYLAKARVLRRLREELAGLLD